MRARAILVVMVAATALVALAASASAGSGTDRATGGGQVLFSDQGAGNTIAFTAQGTQDAAQGQVQVIDRQGGDKFHGLVDCLIVSGDNMAQIYGHNRDTGSPFELYVVDNGEGAAANDDILALNRTPAGNCSSPNSNDNGSTALARGNAQVYNAP